MHPDLLQIMSIKDAGLYRHVRDKEILHLIPEMRPAIGYPGGPYHSESVFEHLLWTSEGVSSKYPLLRFAALLHDIGKPAAWNGRNFRHHDQIGAAIAADIMKRLGGFADEEISFVCGAIAMHMLAPLDKMNEKNVARRIREMESHGLTYRDFLRLRAADRQGTANWKIKGEISSVPYLRKALKQIQRATAEPEAKNRNHLAVTGNDVMAILNIKPGPLVGRVLRFLENNYPRDDREALLNGILEYAKISASD